MDLKVILLSLLRTYFGLTLQTLYLIEVILPAHSDESNYLIWTIKVKIYRLCSLSEWLPPKYFNLFSKSVPIGYILSFFVYS